MDTTKSSKLFAEAQKHLPGGVNSPVRAFKSVGRDPLYIKKAKGSRIQIGRARAFVYQTGERLENVRCRR